MCPDGAGLRLLPVLGSSYSPALGQACLFIDLLIDCLSTARFDFDLRVCYHIRKSAVLQFWSQNAAKNQALLIFSFESAVTFYDSGLGSFGSLFSLEIYARVGFGLHCFNRNVFVVFSPD